MPLASEENSSYNIQAMQTIAFLYVILTGYVELHLGRILSMYIANDYLVGAFIVGFRFPHTEGDRIGFRIREELETATFDDLGDALVELEGWRRRTLHRNGEVRRRIYVTTEDGENLSLPLKIKKKKRKALPSTAEYDSWTSTICGGPGGPTSRRGVLG